MKLRTIMSSIMRWRSGLELTQRSREMNMWPYCVRAAGTFTEKLAPPISMGCRGECTITNILSTANAYIGANTMRRYVLILGLLIAGSASAQAATLHRHDSGYHVFIGPKVASSFDAIPAWAEAPGPSIRHDDVASYNDRWDPWGHWGAYYGPMISLP